MKRFVLVFVRTTLLMVLLLFFSNRELIAHKNKVCNLHKNSNAFFEGVPDILSHRADDSLHIFENSISVGDRDFVAFLLRLGVDPNRTVSTGETALLYSLRKNLNEITELLLRKGADPNLELNTSEQPLAYIIRNGSKKQARLLVQYGANLNAQNKDGLSALFQAVLFKRSHLVQLFVKNGADVVTNSAKRNIFKYCNTPSNNVDYRTKEIFRQLRANPVQMIRLNQNNLLKQFLKERPEAIYRLDRNGNSLYHIAAIFGNRTALEILPNSPALKGLLNQDGLSMADYLLESDSGVLASVASETNKNNEAMFRADYQVVSFVNIANYMLKKDLLYKEEINATAMGRLVRDMYNAYYSTKVNKRETAFSIA